MTPEGAARIVELLDACRRGYEAGIHDEMERALEIAAKFKVALPDWLMTAVLELVRASETPRQKKARQQREIDKLRGMEVLLQRKLHGLSFEAAAAAAAEIRFLGVTAREEAIKQSVDRWLAVAKPKIVPGFGAAPPGAKKPRKKSGRIKNE